MIAFICTAMVAVESFLYALLQSMGLIGGSYNDIANSFPDNTMQQNQVLYSIANNPTNSNGGFAPIEHRYDDDVANFFYWFIGTSEFGPFAVENWDALMNELGFAVVQNNIDVAVSQGFSVNAQADTIDITFTDGTTGMIKMVGWVYGGSGKQFISEYLPNNVHYGYPDIDFASYETIFPVFMTSYHGVTKYSTYFYPDGYSAKGWYINSGRGGLLPWFEDVNGVPYMHWKDYGSDPVATARISSDWYYHWGWEDVAMGDATVIEGVGEEYLSFGDTDNPVVSVSYDPATGVTTYQYKDGSTSITPPDVLGNGVALSPSISQPLTNYIINEGDITNIYNPDAAIPSETVAFDFESLGTLLNRTFIPSVSFPYMTIYNRLMNKATFVNAISTMSVNLRSITPKRPEFYIYGVDFFGWIDTMGENFTNAKNFLAFAMKISMFFGCVSLVMKTFHVNVGTSGG